MQLNGAAWTQGIETAATGADPYTQTKNNVTTFSSFAVQKLPIPDAPTSIYPNPVATTLNVVVRPRQAEQLTLTVYDLSGKQLLVQKESVTAGASLLEINVSKLTAGIYVLKVSSDRDKEFLVRKFMKVN